MIVRMAEIALSNGLMVLVDEDDHDRLAAYAWHAMRNPVGCVYAFRQVRWTEDGVRRIQTLYMHREVLGITDRRVEVDHIDGQTLDNRRANLRTCTHGQNQRNYRRRKGGFSSQFKGVTWDKSRSLWVVKIKVNRKNVHLGRFADEVSAAKAYNAAALRLHGDFACPNVL